MCKVNTVEALKSFFVNYTNFSSRACRSEFWNVQLMLTIFFWVVLTIDAAILGESFWEYSMERTGTLEIIYWLVTAIPQISLMVRRLRDSGKSGWWVLLVLTGVGIILLLIWAIRKSEEGVNAYGENPLDSLKV
jgi:uncharacterized membrane protein YhaH (DUF805 family)